MYLSLIKNIPGSALAWVGSLKLTLLSSSGVSIDTCILGVYLAPVCDGFSIHALFYTVHVDGMLVAVVVVYHWIIQPGVTNQLKT